MGKKVTTISIDENVLRQAKKEIPNFSTFVEDCLKAYLGFGNLDLMTIDENRKIMKNAMLKIQILTSKNDDDSVVQEYTTKQENEVWVKLFGAYRKHQDLTDKDYITAGKILNIDASELKEVFESIEYTLNKEDMVKCNDWNFVKNKFL